MSQTWPRARAVETSSRGTSRILMSQFQGKTGVAPFATEHALEGRKARQMSVQQLVS